MRAWPRGPGEGEQRARGVSRGLTWTCLDSQMVVDRPGAIRTWASRGGPRCTEASCRETEMTGNMGAKGEGEDREETRMVRYLPKAPRTCACRSRSAPGEGRARWRLRRTKYRSTDRRAPGNRHLGLPSGVCFGLPRPLQGAGFATSARQSAGEPKEPEADGGGIHIPARGRQIDERPAAARPALRSKRSCGWRPRPRSSGPGHSGGRMRARSMASLVSSEPAVSNCARGLRCRAWTRSLGSTGACV